MSARLLVALRVDATPERAFEAFTRDIGLWWKPNPLFAFSRGRSGLLAFEPGPGGRLTETCENGVEFEIGRITLWEPPLRLAFTWRQESFTPEQQTEVRVSFEPVGAETRVTVEHRGWDAIPRSHAARHRFPLAAFQQRHAEWWQLLLRSLRTRLRDPECPRIIRENDRRGISAPSARPSGVTSQLDFFADRDGDALAVPELPEGFRYRRELISPAEEDALIARLSSLPFREFEFHGYTGKRRVVSYGWRYDFSQRELRKAEDLPYFLLPLREAAAAFAGLDPQSLEQILVSEYRPGAGIGWHRDKDVFGQTVGVSLHSPCMFRLRRAAGGKWQRAKLMAEPRSAYLLSGSVRSDWEHSIPAVDTLRYSVTFRNLRA